MDLVFIGYSFTWSNKKLNLVYARLERFVPNSSRKNIICAIEVIICNNDGSIIGDLSSALNITTNFVGIIEVLAFIHAIRFANIHRLRMINFIGNCLMFIWKVLCGGRRSFFVVSIYFVFQKIVRCVFQFLFSFY